MVAEYLKPYTCDQNYANYTSREHASWRFIMRNASAFFQDHAHSAYLEGLAKTGISIEHIPDIKEMDRVLAKIGWGAVCVRGYIPPLVFLDFQSRNILPIAGNMRSLEHIIYTPAPDIVHEAAGHAPILADPDYADYLSLYARMARKAIFSSADIRLYEAVRNLSDAKENPDYTEQMIQAAEAELKEAEAAVTWTSEASLIARIYWWTAEYGLIGDVAHPKIYGAGLLSSLSEGRDCLKPEVKKIPFSIDCIGMSFDITEPQPQLYVTPSFKELKEALFKLEGQMAFARGGEYGLATAQKAQSVCSVVLSSGLQVSGVIKEYLGEGDRIDFVRWSGPVQLCFDGKQIRGQGRERHGDGFFAVLGRWQGYPEPGAMTAKTLTKKGWVKGKPIQVEFASGYRLEAIFVKAREKNGSLLFVALKDLRIWGSKGQEIFLKNRECDLVLGESVPSVFGGPADWQAYGQYAVGAATSSPGRQSPFTPKEKKTFALYQRLRDLRQALAGKRVGVATKRKYLVELENVASEVEREFSQEWLLAIEIHEIVVVFLGEDRLSLPWLSDMLAAVLQKQAGQVALLRFIAMGLALVEPAFDLGYRPAS